MATDDSTATHTEETITVSTPDFMNQFFDLRALSMNARMLTYTVSEQLDDDSDELNAVRRVLLILENKAQEFANEADKFLSINNKKVEVAHG